ncbi:CDC45-like protein [Ramaria rubella]|nr:CDC45-like protein [Ramaria rubella]
MYLVPPHLAAPSQLSYGQAYTSILAAHRRSPTTSASSVIILVAPDVDALCAARMLADLFKQDDVMYRIIPVSGMAALESQRNELSHYPELHTLILLNMGAILELPSSEWFGDFSENLTIHVIDSGRPQNLSSLFGGEPEAERVLIWDDGGANGLEEEKKAWEALMYEPEADSDEDSGLDSQSEDDESKDDDDDIEEAESSSSGKRRHASSKRVNPSGKRRRLEGPERVKRMSRDARDRYAARIEKHYSAGTWHGQSASGTIYVLATVLERVDNDSLWLAILGLTFQYTSSRISRDKYDQYHQVFDDEVARLNPPLLPPSTNGNVTLINPDDSTVRTTEELRFTLFRHWTLYDAMYHSSYVANKLGIWRERGRKKLTGLLAKMGFSIPQTQQPYSHMDMDLKRQLRAKLEAIAPEYGLVELTYPSFTRSFGFRTQPLSAADMVESLGALLEVSGGVKMEVEIEGARNGGEWFGGGKFWDAKWREEDRENIPPAGAKIPVSNNGPGNVAGHDIKKPLEWWVRNFWTAYDALDDITRIREALSLGMSLHRAIIRQGSSIIDKQDIKTMNRHRVVVLTQGPDLALFTHPAVLSRLALWLVEALRDKVGATTMGRGKKKCLPFVVACLDEKAGTYIVVGVTAALEFGDVRKNQFGLAFLDAKTRCNARTRHGSFDTSVLEINQADLSIFLETLCHESRS